MPRPTATRLLKSILAKVYALTMTTQDRHALEVRLAHYERKEALHQSADEVLEVALSQHLPLERTLDRMLPVLLEGLNASFVRVHTFDETLEMRDFVSGVRTHDDDTALVAALKEHHHSISDRALGTHLDVAGEDFGYVVVELQREATTEDLDLLRTWTETLDNYLASIATARRKFQVIREISRALREPLVEDGLEKAMVVLEKHVNFKRMLLVFHHGDDDEGASLHFKLADTELDNEHELHGFIREHANAIINDSSPELLAKLGFPSHADILPIYDDGRSAPVGRLITISRGVVFSTFDRDLLERFADHLHQRVVDFNKDWKNLSRAFPPRVVRRLLREPDYRSRFLTPRERSVAILYSDISGFSTLSEQKLREPWLIGRLIDLWSKQVVRIVWAHEGVFDNMVGDCIIAHFGPPFYEGEPALWCRAALDAAREISDYTRSLSEQPEFADVDFPFGVATGVNYAPLCAGIFGPNESFTGFSRGMNNAARLQGLAKRDEILCMESLCSEVDDAPMFSEEVLQAQVKNIAEPLQYRALSDS